MVVDILAPVSTLCASVAKECCIGEIKQQGLSHTSCPALAQCGVVFVLIWA